MSDPILLNLDVEAAIMVDRIQARPGDQVVFTATGRAFVVREFPPQSAHWVDYFVNGVVASRSHNDEETMARLYALAQSPGGSQ